MTMNPEAQAIFDTIISKLNTEEKLSPHDISFLRARRSYLSSWQKLQYGDILYFNKQFLFQKIRLALGHLGRFIKEIVIALLVGLTIFWLSKMFNL
jgi:hypothetical protein